MASSKYSELLKKFLSGELIMEELGNIIDDRLFELRQVPDLTEEEDLLSGIELIMHEIKDGFRSRADLEEYIKSLLTPKTSAICWGDTSWNLGEITSGAVSKEVKTTIVTPDPVVDYRLRVQFV